MSQLERESILNAKLSKLSTATPSRTRRPKDDGAICYADAFGANSVISVKRRVLERCLTQEWPGLEVLFFRNAIYFFRNAIYCFQNVTL